MSNMFRAVRMHTCISCRAWKMVRFLPKAGVSAFLICAQNGCDNYHYQVLKFTIFGTVIPHPPFTSAVGA
jgi:hypothetical protein